MVGDTSQKKNPTETPSYQEPQKTEQQPIVTQIPLSLGLKKSPSKYSIDLFSKRMEEEENKEKDEVAEDNLPKEHFANADIEEFWKNYLVGLKRKDFIVYNAVCDFKMSKHDEDSIIIRYPSESAKMEFDKISPQFFSELKHKLNNFYIRAEYKIDASNMRKERVTKRSIFEKMAEKNPLLHQLNTIFKFDLND